MELKKYIHMQVEGLDHGLKRAIDTLTQEELAWRPACGCNSIGLILFHIAKSEDSFVQARLKGKKELWDTGKWYKKLNLDAKEAGAHYTVEQVNAFPVPELKAILEYSAAVRAETIAYVDSMTAAAFDKKIEMPHFGEMPVAMIFSIIVSHASQHIGEMSYIRGIMRGMDK